MKNQFYRNENKTKKIQKDFENITEFTFQNYFEFIRDF